MVECVTIFFTQNEDNLNNEDDLKLRTSSKMEMTQKMNMDETALPKNIVDDFSPWQAQQN